MNAKSQFLIQSALKSTKKNTWLIRTALQGGSIMQGWTNDDRDDCIYYFCEESHTG